MAQQYQDMVVDEADGKARFNLVDRNGSTVAEDVALELASKVVRTGDDWGALEANLLLTKDDKGLPAPRTDNPHKVTAAQAGAYTKAETDARDRAVADGAAAALKPVADALAGKAPAVHTHDDRYFTESEINAKLNGKAGTAGTYPGLTVGAAQQLTGILPVDRGGTGRQFRSLGFWTDVITTDANGRFTIPGLQGAIAAVGSVNSNEIADTKHGVSFANPVDGRLIGNVFEISTGQNLPGFTCRVTVVYFNFT